MKITVVLQGTSPILMHNPRLMDTEYEITRELKRITAKRKKTDEDLRRIEELEWFGGLYTDRNGEGAIVIVQPTSKVRKCIINTAKISKLGKNVTRALSFETVNVPLVYEGPTDIKELSNDKTFYSRLSVGVGNKRIMRVRPQFFPWALQVNGLLIEDVGINFDEFEHIVELAGVVEGIGDNRVNGYGRFIGKVVKQ